MPLPTKLTLEVVTPAGLLLREEVDEVIAPGEDGYFGVRPGHTPFLSTLGLGEISYRVAGEDAEVALLAGGDDLVHLLAQQEARGRDHVQRELRG